MALEGGEKHEAVGLAFGPHQPDLERLPKFRNLEFELMGEAGPVGKPDLSAGFGQIAYRAGDVRIVALECDAPFQNGWDALGAATVVHLRTSPAGFGIGLNRKCVELSFNPIVMRPETLRSASRWYSSVPPAHGDPCVPKLTGFFHRPLRNTPALEPGMSLVGASGKQAERLLKRGTPDALVKA